MIDKTNVKEFVGKILQQVAEAEKIKKFELISDLNVDCGDGFIGQFYTGQVKNNDNGEIIDVVIKIASVKPAENKVHEMFKNEKLFYTTVIPALNALQGEIDIQHIFDHFPKYFCGELELHQEYIAMNNVKLLGYTMTDKKEFLDEEHLEYIFKIYGRFHALSFLFKKLKPKEFKDVTSEFIDIYQGMSDIFSRAVQMVIEATLKFIDLEGEKNIYEKVKHIVDNFKEFYEKGFFYKGAYSCITHGDCWSNNMFFKYTDIGKLENMKLLDFQFCRESTPIHDLSYFFYSGASKNDFDKLDSYLEIYHQSFVQCAKEFGFDGDDLFPLEVLKREWKDNSLLGIFMGVLVWQIKLISKEECKELVEDVPVNNIKDEHKKWERAVGKVHSNTTFKERTRDILIHAVEYGIF